MATELARSLNDSSGELIICFSHLRWNFVYQRPQHLLSRAAKSFAVYYFEEPIFEEIAVPRLETNVTREGVMLAVPVLPAGLSDQRLVRTQRKLLDQLLAPLNARTILSWYYTPMALPFSRHLDADFSIYDNMDELSLFRGAHPRMVALERELFSRADVVFTGGLSLYEAKRTRHSNVHAFPSSIDTAHFVKARQPALATEEYSGLPRPLVGFFGVIDERMDLDLVAGMADLRPNWQFLMIGPVVKIDAANLPRRNNIHWLGPRTYDELPSHLAAWDLGIMPFALNEATRFISPTKTPEFLAAGVPVISTAITDVIRPYGQLGLVEVAKGATEFIDRAERLLGADKHRWLRRVDEHLANSSWDLTWSEMLGLIRKGMDKRHAEPAGGRIEAAANV